MSKSSRTRKIPKVNISKDNTFLENLNCQTANLTLPKIETKKVCLNLPKLEIGSEKVCFDVPKIETPACSCPPPKVRCPTRNKKVTTRAIIPKSIINSSIGGPLSLGEIEIGEVTIPSLQLADFSGTFTYASCKAKNVELEITLSINTTFTGTIDLPWPLCWDDFCYDVSGGVDFDSYVEKQALGDILFSNGQFSMLSPKTSISPFSMTPQPIRNTTIEKVTTENVKMNCTSIPIDTPLGIDMGICLPIPNPMGPNDVITEETNIDRMDSTGISTPQATMKNIAALNITIPSVTTQGFEAQSTTPIKVTTSKKMFGAGVTLHGDAKSAHINGKLTLNISKIIMRVKGGLEFTNLKGTVKTASATATKLNLTLVLKGIKIKDLNLCGMKISEIEVAI